MENIGGHYAKTLRLWKEKFLESFDEKIRPALAKEHPDMTQEGIEVFRRKWEVRTCPRCFTGNKCYMKLIYFQYYFTYCEAGFVTKTLGDVIITVGREGALELMDGIPL